MAHEFGHSFGGLADEYTDKYYNTVSFNPNTKELYANSNGVEATGGETIRDYLSNGFKLRGTSGGTNASSGRYIYMAFAESPFVNSSGVPTNAK